MKISGEGKYVDTKGRRHKIEGFGSIPDEMPIKSLAVEGVLSFEKSSCEILKINGECRGISLTAKNVYVSGMLEIETTTVAEVFKIEGTLKASHIEADKISIESRSGSIDELKCQQIKIVHNENFEDASRFQIKSIEATDVHLENCKVGIIRCKDAFIGKNCSIEKLFVAGECKVADDSKVGETILI